LTPDPAKPTGSSLEDEWFDILQKARTGLGWSLTQAAQAAAVSFETLEHWESGAGAPHLGQLADLAGALGLDPRKLAAIREGGGLPAPRSREGSGPIRYLALTGSMQGYPVHAYLLVRDGAPDAVLIDTGYEPIHALETVLQRRLALRWIVLTHCHRDHMEGASFLKAQTGARVAVPEAECGVYRAHHHEEPDLSVAAHTRIDIGPDFSLRALATPGHTVGGTSYLVGGLCGVGDALFAGSTGRSMSPAGYASLLASLRERIFSLPDDTVLLPGHGPLTTVGDERRNNPFFPVHRESLTG
jgi:glyoxylase-like metal-dependent hydrolase (beta-lactamase superfamily II)/DNA-binding XRE family transcriptional regulator